MKFKGLEKNSVIREIGSIFRHQGGSDWHINVKLAPNQKKYYFGFSQVPVLARRRVLKATEESRPAGFKSSVTVVNTRFWEAERIKACPIPAVNRQGDSKQWCFVFDFNGTRTKTKPSTAKPSPISPSQTSFAKSVCTIVNRPTPRSSIDGRQQPYNKNCRY